MVVPIPREHIDAMRDAERAIRHIGARLMLDRLVSLWA
jgi:hypothetical protein